MRAHRVRAAIAFLFIAVNVSTAEARKSAVQELASMRPTKAGVDSRNNFWAYDAKRSVVTRITPDGDRYESDILPEAWAVDAEQDRGIALLTAGGRAIDIRDWSGSKKRSIRLLHSATDVAWLSGSHVAVTPQTTGPCVEIWDVSTGDYLIGFGTCPDVAPTHPGVFPARASLLRYDAAHHEIITFDAFRCDLTAFSETGSITRRAHVQHPKAAGFDEWLKTLDANAKAHRGASVPVIQKYASMTIAPDRSILLGENGDDAGVTTVAILPDGTVKRTRVNLQCPSIRFVAWGDDLVFYRDPRLNKQVCTEVRRIK